MTKTILKKIIISIITWEARVVLRKYKPKIVAVTGSVGKTTTKDAIYAVLSGSQFVRKSAKSFNSDIGVPLTILGTPNGWNNVMAWMKNILEGLALIVFKNNYPKWLVLEVGADRPGDIKKLTEWLKPDVVVITRFSKVPVHVEYFDSPQAVVREKMYLALALKKEGILILNADDEDVLSFRGAHHGMTMLYGFDPHASVVASNENILYEKKGDIEVPCGINFKASYAGNTVPVFANGSLGRQHIYPALAALAVGATQQLNLVKMTTSLGNYRSPAGRMKIVEGVKGSVIIDDSYNSSPVAVAEALDTLSNLKSFGKKIAVLGDMMELGKYSIDEHKAIGKRVAEVCDVLVTVGIRARYIAEGALNNEMDEKNIFQFEHSVEAGKHLELMIGAGDIALIKGSQSTRMEKAVEEVMAHPEDKAELLVRQDEEWIKR